MNSKFNVSDQMRIGIGKGFKDSIKLTGYMIAEQFDKFGNTIDRWEKGNTVTNLCYKMIADQLLVSPSIAKPGWMEVGTGSGQGVSSTTLAAYIANSRTALSSKTRGDNSIVTMVCTITPGAVAVTEAGVFNVATQNTTDLLLYNDFAVKNLDAGDSIQFTWTLTASLAA